MKAIFEEHPLYGVHISPKFRSVLDNFWEEQKAENDWIEAIELPIKALPRHELTRKPIDIDAPTKEWPSIAPELPRPPQKDTAWGPWLKAKILHPKWIPIPVVKQIATATNALHAEVDRILEQTSWKPVLGESIANCPRFEVIHPRMEEALESLNRALEFAQSSREQMPNEGKKAPNKEYAEAREAYLTDRVTLKEKVAQARQLCVDHEKATDMIDKAYRGNLGAISLGVAQYVAPAILPLPLAPFASLALDLAEDRVKQADRNRSDEIVNRLNEKYAEIPEDAKQGAEQLQKLRKWPMKEKRKLLYFTLFHERTQEKSADKKRALKEDMQHVRDGTLVELRPDSRAVALLTNQRAFKHAAYRATERVNLPARLGANIAGFAIDALLDAATANLIPDIDLASAAATGVEAGVNAGATVAASAANARGRESSESASGSHASGANSTATVPDHTTRAMQGNSTWPPTSTALLEGAQSFLGGMQTFGETIGKEAYNVAMGMYSKPTYRKLLDAYQTAAAFLEVDEDTDTPPSPQNGEVERKR